MIKLSDMLIATLDDKDPLIALQINEAKRLEALDVPRNEAERKPLVDIDGDWLFFVVDNQGITRNILYERSAAERSAESVTKKEGKPHAVCQVMAPESGECPTIPVATFTPTPERPHEWVIYNANARYEGRWFAMDAGGLKYWASRMTNKDAQRFATAAEAQDYIDANDIQDAYPWPVPKLTS